MSDLNQVLTQIRQRIAKNLGKRSMNEENTKATLIEPVLRALGWNIEDIEEVVREYRSKKADKPVDYALLVLRAPKLFVEAKALGMNLDDRKWAGQIMGYAGVAGVEWIVLTDGNEYRIYNSHAAVSVDEKIFRTVRISDDSSLAEETLRLLSKEQMSENKIEMLWKIEFVDRKVKSAVEDLFGIEPNPSLIRLIRKRVQSLSSRDIQSSLGRAQLNLDFPIAVDPSATTKSRAETKYPSGKRPRTSRASALDIIAEGISTLPLQLEAKYKGNKVTAILEPDGSIIFSGERFDSLSAAGGRAKQSVLGSNKPPATNGWDFWCYRDETGALQKMATLRQELAGR